MRGERLGGYLGGAMAGESIEVGDQVVNLQMPGVFRVIGRHGRLLDIESPQGVRMTVRPEAVRKLDAAAG